MQLRRDGRDHRVFNREIENGFAPGTLGNAATNQAICGSRMRELEMKCEGCLKLLEEYLDGELSETEAAPVSAHLITCATCAHEFDALTAEQDLYARYDRELDIAPSMWATIAARTVAETRETETRSRFRLRDLFVVPSFGWSFGAAIAVLIFAVAMGMFYFRTRQTTPRQYAKAGGEQPKPIKIEEEKQPAKTP